MSRACRYSSCLHNITIDTAKGLRLELRSNGESCTDEAPANTNKLKSTSKPQYQRVTTAHWGRARPPELLDALARVYARAAIRHHLAELEAKEVGAASPVTEAEPTRQARKRRPRVRPGGGREPKNE